MITFACFSLTAPSTHLLAQQRNSDTGVSLYYEHTESDNVRRTVEPESGSSDSIGLIADYQATSRRFDFDLLGDAQYIRYDDETSDDELAGIIDTTAIFYLIEEVANVFVKDTYTQRRSNPLGPNNPDNREGFNTFSTGLEATLSLGERNSLELRGTYGTQRSELTDENDLDYVSYESNFYRTLGNTTTVGLLAQSTEFMYELGLFDYRIDSLMMSYEKTLRKGTFVARAGQNRIVSENSDTTGPRYFLGWERPVGGRSYFALELEQEFSDSSDAFALSSQSFGVADPSNIPQTTSPLMLRRARIRYNTQFSRTYMALQASVFDQDFESDDRFDNESYNARLILNRRLSPRNFIEFNAEILHREFTDSGDTFTEPRYSLFFTRQLGRKFSLGLGVRHWRREGSDPFDETSGSIRLSYRLIGE